MLAVESSLVTEPVVIAFLVAVVGPCLVVLLQTRTRREAKNASEKATQAVEAIGVPNGNGNVVQMLTTILTGQAGQDGRIARLEGQYNAHDRRLSQIEDRNRAITARLTQSKE